MNNNMVNPMYPIICNNLENISNVTAGIANHPCSSSTEILNADFIFLKCNVDYRWFTTIVNSIKEYFVKCMPQFLLHTNHTEYISHIAIAQNERMGEQGIKYLVDSLCNFTCDFINKTSVLGLDKSVNFLITFVNNSLAQINSIVAGCQGSEIHSEEFEAGTNFSMLHMDSMGIRNSCRIDNPPSHSPLSHPAAISYIEPLLLVGGILIGALLSALLVAYKDACRDENNNSYSIMYTPNIAASTVDITSLGHEQSVSFSEEQVV